MGTLEISLLGGFQLRRDGALLEPIALRAGRSLLAYLVMNRERPHTRDLLAGTFWPDLPDARARRRLSQALWQVQARISPGEDPQRRLLATAGDTVGIDTGADFWLDVDEFEWTLEQAAPAAVTSRSQEAELLAAAVRLYRGDLLEGMYDDWAVPDRERLSERFLGVLERLTDLVMSRGDYETALIHARRLAQLAPMREEAHQRVMRLAVLLGRHNDAIRQYELCRRILADELGARPSPATRQIYEATVAERESGHPTRGLGLGAPLFEPAGQVPFVGREQERSMLLQRLDAALDGHGGLVLLEGESGVGKTRLLAEVVEDGRWRGMDVLWGRSSPSGGRPYAPLAEALVGGLSPLRARQLAQRLETVWREPLAHLVPALAHKGDGPTAAPLRPADEQARMREAIALALLSLADIAPLLVVLEDVHWADEDSIQALAHLAGRTEGHRIVIAVSYRHAEARERPEVWGLLRSLDRRPSCARLSLSPCSPAQTEELVRRCLGLSEVSAEYSQRVHRETGGIPLFVIEALRAQYEQGDLDEVGAGSAEEGTDDDRLPMTPRVHGLMRSRLAGLDAEAKAILDLVSVHDGELALAEIVAAGAQSDEAVLRAVDDLARRRLLAERPGGYQVSHELLRRVVYDDLPLSARLDLHRRVALAVEAHRPDEVEVLAHHFATAHIPDRAADYLERAADRALEVRAYDTAAFHLARAAEALDQIDAPAERHFRVAARQEEVLDVLARRTDQEAALVRMERYATSEVAADVHRRRAWWLAHVDRFPEAQAEAQRALELARGAGDGGRAVAALSTLGMIACFAGRAADGVVHLEAAAAFRGADRRQQADARNALGQNLIDLQRFDEAESQLLAALALYGEIHDARGQAEVLGMLGTLRMERGESDLAEADFNRAIDMSRAIGYRHGEAVYQMNLGILLVIKSRLGAALRAFEGAAATYSEIANGRGRALVLANSAWIRHANLGDNARAELDVIEAYAVYEQIGDIRGRAQCLVILGSIKAGLGLADEGRHLLEEGVALTLEAEDSWLAAQALRELASVELAAGLADAGIDHTTQAESLCEQIGMNDLRVSIKALRGRLLLQAGQTTEAVRVTAQAMAGLNPGVELAYQVPFAHGLALAAAGKIVEADHYLELAHTHLQALLSDLSETDRASALSAVPAHREVIDAWTRRRPQRAEQRLARTGVPTGRPLAPHERIAVTWTLHIPADDEIRDQVERRRRRLLRLLGEAAAQGGAPTVDDLAAALEASIATVRRDLAALRLSGEPALTRGTRHSPPR
jgi:DNA-binding SARP family transcriptional activator/tetratricopeptide (TPR) repeat protein